MKADFFSISVAVAANSEANIPQWVEIIPPGEHVVGRDGRSWINDAPEKVVEAFENNNADLPIDLEHATERKAKNGEPAPAVGWLKALQAREGGSIWGMVEWTSEGQKLLANKSYRYLSPVFAYNRVSNQILQLYSAGLTNQPNLHLTALNQRTKPNGENAMDIPLAICTALGLSADATEKQVVSTIAELTSEKDKALNAAETPSLEKFVPRADHDVALNRAKEAEAKLKAVEETALNQQIDDAVTAALKKGVITPATADFHRAACKREDGLAEFQKFVEVAPVIAEPSTLDDKEPSQTEKGLNAEDRAACDLLGISTEDFLKAKKEAA